MWPNARVFGCCSAPPLSEKEQKYISLVFNKMDRDHSGGITREDIEFVMFYRSDLGDLLATLL